VCETSFYIKEKLQIKGMCEVGAEENMFVSGKKCNDSYFIIWTLHKYFWGDEIKKSDMSRACSTHERHN